MNPTLDTRPRDPKLLRRILSPGTLSFISHSIISPTPLIGRLAMSSLNLRCPRYQTLLRIRLLQTIRLRQSTCRPRRVKKLPRRHNLGEQLPPHAPPPTFSGQAQGSHAQLLSGSSCTSSFPLPRSPGVCPSRRTCCSDCLGWIW